MKLMISWLACLSVVTAVPTLHIGISTPDLCIGYHVGGVAYAAKLAWDAKWAPIMPQNPSNFNVDVSFQNTFCKPGAGFSGVLNMMQGASPIHVLVGGMISPICVETARLGAAFGIPQLASACIAGELRQESVYPTFTTMMPSNRGGVKAALTYVKKLEAMAGEKLKIFSFYFTDESLGRSSLDMALDVMPSMGMGDITVNYVPLVYKAVDIDPVLWKDAFQKALAIGANVNFLAFQAGIVNDVMPAMHAAGLTGPGKIWMDVIGSSGGLSKPDGFLGQLFFLQASRGPNFKTIFEDFWTKLSPANFSGVGGGYFDGNHPVGPHTGKPKIASSLFTAPLERNRYGQEVVSHNGFDAVLFMIHLFDKHMKSAAAGSDPAATFRKNSVVRALMQSTSVEGCTGGIAFTPGNDRDAVLDISNRLATGPKIIGSVNTNTMAVTETGKWTFNDGSTNVPSLNPPVCAQGNFINSVTGVCSACPPGKYGAGTDVRKCTDCPPGEASSEVGAKRCTLCEKGTEQPEKGQQACAKCTPGRNAANRGTAKCIDCLAGQYSGLAASECELCEEGRYQALKAQSDCKSCHDHIPRSSSVRSATSVAQCQCEEESYFRPGVGCEVCIEGMVCPGDNKRPTQVSGYYVEVTEESTLKTDVFQCVNPDWCPAGKLSLCDTDRYGRSCAKVDAATCPTYFWPLGVIAVFVVCYIGYQVSSRQTFGKQTPMSMLAANINICIVAMQSIGVYFQFFKDIPAEVAPLAFCSQAFTMQFQTLMPGCNIGQEFETRFSAAIFPPILVVGALSILFLVTNALSKVGVPAMKFDNVINIGGTFLQVMYVMQCKDAFSFICRKDNPSDVQTLQYYTDVVYASDEHMSVGPIIIDLYLFLAYVIGIFGCLTYAVCMAPDKIKEASFRTRWNFLLSKWRPARMYWGLCLLFRNMFICLAPIIVDSNKVYRSMCYALCFLVHALGEARFMPWMSFMNASFEMTTSGFLIGLSFSGLQLSYSSSTAEKQTAAFLMYIWMLCIWILFAVSGLHIVMRLKNKDTVSIDKSKAGFRLITKCVEIEEANRKAGTDEWTAKFKGNYDYDMHVINECFTVLSDMQDDGLAWRRPSVRDFVDTRPPASAAPQNSMMEVTV